MNVSLNEVEAMAKKAARGAGYSWGMAEEAAMATRWLCAHGLDGCASLAALLEKTDGAMLADLAPMALVSEWRASSGVLCPVMTGAALSDCATRLKYTDIQLTDIAEPVLVLPFVAAAARQLGMTITVAWQGLSATTDGTKISWKDADGLTVATTVRVTIRIGGDLDRSVPRHTRTAPDVAVWDRLLQLAGRTYAPATEKSRLLGAGGGDSDSG